MSNAESDMYFHLLIHLITLYIAENKLHAPKQTFQGQIYYRSTQENEKKNLKNVSMSVIKKGNVYFFSDGTDILPM